MSKLASEQAEHGRQLILLEEAPTGATAPRSARRRRDQALVWLFVAVLATTALYNFIIATPRYSSEFSYVVRSLDSSRERFSFLNIAASGGGADNSEAIIAYIRSRDMLEAINGDGLVSRVFSARRVDAFSAFPSLLAGHTREDFYRHFQGYISPDFDKQSNITYVSVEAFSPGDARNIAQRVMEASERMVNGLNARARQSIIASARKEADAATASLANILDELSRIRDRDRVLEPKLEAKAAIKVYSASAAELARMNVELAQTMRVAPDSPVIGQLRTRRNAIEAELLRQMATTAGSPRSLAGRIRPYEELTVRREVAEKRLLAASLGLVSARNSASRNRLYIERISQPSYPDRPRFPRGALNLLITALIALAILWIVRSLSDLILDDDE